MAFDNPFLIPNYHDLELIVSLLTIVSFVDGDDTLCSCGFWPTPGTERTFLPHFFSRSHRPVKPPPSMIL